MKRRPLFNIPFHLRHVTTVIKSLIKKPKLYHCELANYRHNSNLPFMSKKFIEVTFTFKILKLCLLNCAPSCKKIISMKNFSQVFGPTIAQKLHLLKLQITCFLRQTKAASHC